MAVTIQVKMPMYVSLSHDDSSNRAKTTMIPKMSEGTGSHSVPE
ncbi:MAG: hypothetical protein ACOYM1_12055 [Methylovulum sp.]